MSRESIDLFDNKIHSYRRQETIMNEWLVKRLDTVLPKIMERENIDFWVVACREYNEDPVFAALAPVSMITARRLTIFAFYNQNGKVRRMSLCRAHSDLAEFYESVWNWTAFEETQTSCLARIIKECNPKKIALNFSKNYAFGDGLSHYLYEQITNDFDDEMKSKIVSAENLCVGLLETRLPEELAAYTGIVELAHSLIATAFSSKVITVGVTTNADVKYYMMQKAVEYGLAPWFDFSVSIQRCGKEGLSVDEVIMPGDLLHCDIGLKYLGLCTDTQELAYVLKLGEEEAPQGILDGFKTTNRFQDIVINNYKAGLTGNEILAQSLKDAQNEKIIACLYTHPIGRHGHGAGPTIGLWDQQDGVPGCGDYKLYNDTMYSLELNTKSTVKEWNNQSVMFALETDIIFTNDEVHYVAKRQEKLHYIK